MFSVVIPLFNKAPFIATTLASVLDQSYDTFELIVVNDGSTDDSLEIVKEINDTRIRIISIENSGVSVARNTGIEAASHEYIAFLDADDSWAATFLEEMKALIQLHPKQSLFASGRSSVFEDKSVRYQHTLLPQEGEWKLLNHFEVIMNHLPAINMSNSVVRKAVFSSQGMFTPGQKNHEDHDLWLRLAVGNPIVYLHKNLSFYRKDVALSASGLRYSAPDFITYLQTIYNVGAEISSREKNFLTAYANRFVLLTYIKYYKYFGKNEDMQVVLAASKVTSNLSTFAINLLHRFPYKGMYGLLSKIRRSGR